MAGIVSRLKHAWNAFASREDQRNYGPVSSGRPDRARMYLTNEQTIISGIYARIAVDTSEISIKHVRLDEVDRYSEDIDSSLNECLTVQANLDQAATAFRRDIVLTTLDKGVAAVVPVDTTLDPKVSGNWDIKTMRVGEILEWMPEHIRVRLYNQATGKRQEIVVQKSICAIVENPLYSVMNEPNSTLRRLIRTLSSLDAITEQSASGKLDIIIQLPYVIKSEARRQQADQRRIDMESQLSGSKYGVAYSDATEKITQLNRPAENNLLAQVTYLTEMLYGQLGITEAVMNGTADEATMLNYYNRTVEPLLTAIVEAMTRSFLTKTARTQGQSIMFFRNPFKLIPIGGIGGIADIADKLARNEVLTSNELRQIIGYEPSKDPKADELTNSNMPQPGDQGQNPQDQQQQPVPSGPDSSQQIN